MSAIEFLTVEQVCEIQKDTLSCAPPANLGLIEGAINRVINAHYYEDMTDIFELAAMYLLSIARAHAFPDANKRTAFKSAMLFLDVNGIIGIDSSELTETTVRAAQGLLDVKQIAWLLKENLLDKDLYNEAVKRIEEGVESISFDEVRKEIGLEEAT